MRANLRLRAITPVLVLATALVLVADAVLGIVNIRRISDAERWVTHTHEALESLQELHSAVQHAESSQRGYLISGHPAFLEEYHHAVSSIPARLDLVDALTQDNPLQQARLAELAMLIDERTRALRQVLDAVVMRRDGLNDLEQAREPITSLEGARLMAELDTRMERMEDHERALASLRARAATKAGRTSVATTAVGLLLSLLLVGATLTVLRERLAERLRSEAKLSEEHARLEEMHRRKNDFLAMLSHELRNPLAPIRNSAVLLEHQPSLDAQGRRAVAIITRQAAHLASIVDDLLDVTRYVRGKLVLSCARIDLAELVERLVDDYRATVPQGVTLVAPPGPTWIRGDSTRLRQALGNLLSNAAKFTPPTGDVLVRLTHAADRAVLEVADSGVGIDAQLLGHIFEPFTQADRSLARTDGGLGLGLSVVKGIIELHGGTVAAESEGANRGARFIIELPAEVSATQPADGASQLAEPPVDSTRRVLVIEDNRDTAESLRTLLELEGHVVDVAHDGPEGVRKARELHPDVVLCDIGLPGLSGYDVARAVRADNALDDVALVAVTGYAGPEDRQRAAEAGFVRHLAKPMDPERLGALLGGLPRAAAGSPA